MTREEHKTKIDEIIKENQAIKAVLSNQNNMLSQVRNYASADFEEPYQRGLDDAWECARRIALYVDEGGIDAEELLMLFGTYSIHNILRRCSAQEAVAKMAEYEKQKDEIRVGDEVIAYPGISNSPFVVINVNEEAIHGIDASGLYRGCARSEADFTKTGRSFPQIAEVMKAMQGDES